MAELVQAWTELLDGVPTLMACIGRTPGCLRPVFQGTQSLLLAPEGIPDNVIHVVNDCGDGPLAGLYFNVYLTQGWDTVTWDPGYGHGSFDLVSDDSGIARFSLHGGGCTTNSTASVECMEDEEHVYHGAKSPDVDGDCWVKPNDLAYVASKLGTADFCGDLDESGLVDAADLAIVESTMWDHCSQEAARVDLAGALEPELLVYPNPAATRAELRLVTAGRSIEDCFIADAGGRRIRSFEVARDRNDDLRATWDLRDDAGADVAAGLYFVVARLGSGRLTRQVLIVR